MPVDSCPACGSTDMRAFYRVQRVPVHSVVLLHSRDEAVSYPKGDICLAFCEACGVIANLAYDQGVQDYSAEYEATQAFSPTFGAFARGLAERLVAEYDLHGKDIIEIGCGQGEFLQLLCDLGGNRGIGFDPAYVEGRGDISLGALGREAATSVRVVKDYYGAKHADLLADMVVCRMTLEHIQQVGEFMRTVQRTLRASPHATVFFQVPDVWRILQEAAFWDIYYEHCSYLSAGSLARLFRRSGLDVLRLSRDYGQQYLLIEARPGHGDSPALALEDDLSRLRVAVVEFPQRVRATREHWRNAVREWSRSGRKVVIWGAGSKGVAFLTTLAISEAIEYAVDINPNKHGTYLAGSGQEVVSPGFLQRYRPDVVIVMNPVYRREVREQLEGLGVQTQVISV